MRTRRGLRWSAALVTAGLLLGACSDDKDSSSTTAAPASTGPSSSAAPTESTGAPTDSTDTPSTDSAPGGTDAGGVEDCVATVPGSSLTFAAYAPTATLDPLQSSSGLVGGTDLAAVYDVLVRWDKETNSYVPHMAESVTSNADFTEWTVKLRDDVTYSDGSPMRAQDVIDNMKRLQGPGRNSARGMIAYVDLEAATATDDLTAVFPMKQPWSSFNALLGETAGNVVNPKVADLTDDSGASVISNDPTGAGAGPYTVARWAPGESPYLVLKARQDYWGGAPCIETLNFIYLPLDSAKAEAMETGEIDVAFMRTQADIEEARTKGYAELTEFQSSGLTVMANLGEGNHAEITNDVRFRQALAAALDPEVMRDRGYDGVLTLHSTFVSPESVYYTEGQPAPEANMDRAKELVEELKGEGWDGKIRLMCANTTPDAIVAASAMMEAAGMTVDQFAPDTNTTIAKIAVEHDWDLACWGLPIADSAAWRAIPNNFKSTSGANRIGWQNADMDAAIDEFLGAANPEAAKAAVAKMAKEYAADLPMVVLGGMDEGVFMQSWVTDVVQTEMSIFLFGDAKVNR